MEYEILEQAFQKAGHDLEEAKASKVLLEQQLPAVEAEREALARRVHDLRAAEARLLWRSLALLSTLEALIFFAPGVATFVILLTRYALASGLRESAVIIVASLAIHPALAWVLADHVFALPPEFVRAAVVTAAMPPGVNAFLFASMYDRAVDVAAATVLLATLVAVASASLWLAALQNAFP